MLEDTAIDLRFTPKELKRLIGFETDKIPPSSIALDRLKFKSFVNQRIKQTRNEFNWLFIIISSFVWAGSYFSIVLLDKLLLDGTLFTHTRSIVTSSALAIGCLIICNIFVTISMRVKLGTNKKSPHLSTLRSLLDDINNYNQAVTTLAAQIRISNLSGTRPYKEKLVRLEQLKDNLIKALKTERIIRENPNFDPNSVAANLVSTTANEVNKKASYYSTELANSIEAGLKIKGEIGDLIK